MRSLAILVALTAIAAADPPRPRCDAAALQKRGEKLLAEGQTFAAAAAFVDAIRCAPNEQRYMLAIVAICRSEARCGHTMPASRVQQLKSYVMKLPAHRRNAAYQMCTPVDCRGSDD